MGTDERPITIVGCGPGSLDFLPPVAVRAVEHANVLVGAEKLFDLFPDSLAERIPLGKNLKDALDAMDSRVQTGRIAVLVSGDPGLFSLAKLVIRRFGRKACRIIPGISSVQAAFALVGIDWVDAVIVSAHKEDPTTDQRLRHAKKIAVLAGREESLTWVAEKLLPYLEGDRRIFVLENLTLPDERMTETLAENITTLPVSNSTIVVIVANDLLED
jgi:cobalt-precorrin-7 (C5)-methyltransferase